MRSRVAGWSTRRFTAQVPVNVNSEALPTVDLERHILRTNNTLRSWESSGQPNIVNSADEALGESLPLCNARHKSTRSSKLDLDAHPDR